MSLTMTGQGLQFPSPGNRRNIKRTFFLRDNNPNSTTYSGSWTTGWTTNTFTIPAKCELDTHVHWPIRNNSTSWGGGYSRMYYEVNGNGWIYGGQYGYCRGAMGHGRYMISGTDWVQAFDFKGMTSDFTLRFRYDHLTHDGTAYTGADHGLTGASNQDYHGAQTPWMYYLNIQGWQYE